MAFLDSLFTRFDSLVDSMENFGVYKVETIGGACILLRVLHVRC